jgi:hypothetical protein
MAQELAGVDTYTDRSVDRWGTPSNIVSAQRKRAPFAAKRRHQQQGDSRRSHHAAGAHGERWDEEERGVDNFGRGRRGNGRRRAHGVAMKTTTGAWAWWLQEKMGTSYSTPIAHRLDASGQAQ